MLQGLLEVSGDEDGFSKVVEGLFEPETDYRYAAVQKAHFCLDEFETPGAVRARFMALVLIENLKVKDHDVIIAALLGGALEGAPSEAIRLIDKEFGYKVARLVKLSLQPLSVKTPCEAVTIQLLRCIHVCMTAKSRDGKFIREAEEIYLPLAKKHEILVAELKWAIENCGRGVAIAAAAA